MEEKDCYPSDELANCITHGFGLCLSLIGLIILVTLASYNGEAWHVAVFSVYGSSLVILYGASTFYHSYLSERSKTIFRLLDHCAIYLLIAGTYTPFTLVTLKGEIGWPLFICVWSLASAGIVFEIFYNKKYKRVFSTIIYLVMGWLIVFAFEAIIEALPPAGFHWLVAGGLSYSIGVIFYAWEGKRFNHMIWHLFVLVGSFCHFLTIYFYVLP